MQSFVVESKTESEYVREVQLNPKPIGKESRAKYKKNQQQLNRNESKMQQPSSTGKEEVWKNI